MGDSSTGKRALRGGDGTLDGYRRSYDPTYPVVCMDETPRQLIRQTRVPIPARPGQPARHDYEYRRCAVCNVFMAIEPLAGKRLTKVTERKTKIDWQFTTDDARAKLKRLYSTFDV